MLKFEGGEVALDRAIITCGRTTDNTVAFPEDSNVSRYHAEIEPRDGEYWLIDLGSSNGTTLNGEKVSREMLLRDGDKIVFGGSSEIGVRLGERAEDETREDDAESAGGEMSSGGFAMQSGPSFAPSDLGAIGGSGAGATASAGASAGGSSGTAAGVSGGAAAGGGSGSTVLVAGAVVGLAVVCVVAAGAFYLTRGSGCQARAVISKPEPGETITKPVDIEVDSENAECVASAVFTLDGEQIATTNEQPFTAKLDPKEFPDLSDGFEHNLQIVLIDDKGQQVPQPESVMLAFETREIKKPEATPEVAQGNTKTPGTKNPSVSLLDVQEMSKRLAKQFSGNNPNAYNVSNKQFLQEIQKKTAEYAQAGYFQKAGAYRDVINVAYTQEQNLDASLGFMLAMSRSKFVAAKQGNDEGLWRMSNDFVVANGYNGLCGTETLSDQSQNCAAKASALYMKAIVFGVFDGDVIYSAAAFGKAPADAGVWKASLPQNRSDIWNSIKTPQEREQIVRFFAAGIVAENPQKFGLAKDRPLSELYRVTM